MLNEHSTRLQEPSPGDSDVEHCWLAGFTPAGSSVEIAGISLVHSVDKAAVGAGDSLLLTAWILNATSETLTDVTLVPRSLTNARLDSLQYETQPAETNLKGQTLGPCQSLHYSFKYEVTSEDVEELGSLISALQAQVTSETLGRLHSECDAIVFTCHCCISPPVRHHHLSGS